MGNTKDLNPDSRERLKSYLVVGLAAYLAEVAGRYFGENAADADNRELLIESVASALKSVTASDPTGPAVLVTFATELLEQS